MKTLLKNSIICDAKQWEVPADILVKDGLIAVKGRLDETFEAMAHVDFVMNRGTVIVPLT